LAIEKTLLIDADKPNRSDIAWQCLVWEQRYDKILVRKIFMHFLLLFLTVEKVKERFQHDRVSA